MRVLDAGEVEKLFPVGTLFLQRRWAVADLDPAGGLVFAEPRILHIAEIFALGDGSVTQSSGVDSVQQVGFSTGFYTGSDQVTHNPIVTRNTRCTDSRIGHT